MSVTRKSDVKNHLSALGRVGHSPILTVTLPIAAGSAAPDAEVKSDPAAFTEDFINEHAPHGISIVPDAPRSPSK